MTITEAKQATIQPEPAGPEAPGAASDRPQTAPIAWIDLDRFCGHCSYNLRTQPVHRDERTEIPVVRCPECGKFQPANDGSTVLRPWLNRLSAVALMAWMLTLLSTLFFFGLGQGALTYATLDELTVYGGSTVQRINNTTIRTWGSYGPLEINANFEHQDLFIATILCCSAAAAFCTGMFLVVVFPHWKKRAYGAVIFAVTVIASGIVAMAWRQEAPHLFDWALTYVLCNTWFQLAGGFAGIFFGRPLARLAVRIVFPPSVRPRLAYLWSADGKPFPSPRANPLEGPST